MKTRKRSIKKNIPPVIMMELDGVTDFLMEHPIVAKYSNRINDKLRAEFGVIEEIVSHAPTVGTFYERLLASNLTEVLPSKWKVGTGFVFDNQSTAISPQIDILIYDDTELAPFFRSGDLVIIQPQLARAVIEVKKKLRLKDIDDLVEKYLFANTGSESFQNPAFQVLNVFSFGATASIEKCYERTVRAIEDKLKTLVTATGQLQAVRSLTLPRFYFLNDARFIETRLKNKGSVHSLEVSMPGILYSNGGASDLFSRLMWHYGVDDLSQIRFNTVGLYSIGPSKIIDVPLILRRLASVREVYSGFSDEDRARINRTNLRRIVGFEIHPDLDLKSLDALQAAINNNEARPIFHGPESVETDDDFQ
jgi:hypothetical protein